MTWSSLPAERASDPCASGKLAKALTGPFCTHVLLMHSPVPVVQGIILASLARHQVIKLATNVTSCILLRDSFILANIMSVCICSLRNPKEKLTTPDFDQPIIRPAQDHSRTTTVHSTHPTSADHWIMR